MLKLNLGCGKTKFPDFVNIDCEESVKPDLVYDFQRKQLPYQDFTVDEVYMIHVIEHIEKIYHLSLLMEINRILKQEGKFVIAYPEFDKCVWNYQHNYKGKREFWEATIYGRQSYPKDYHVSLMDTKLFIKTLSEAGFCDIKVASEPEPEEFNTIISCVKDGNIVTREDILRRELFINV